MFCPRCGAEYRPGYTTCADCQVFLVPAPPGVLPESAPELLEEPPAEPGDPSRDPFCSFWKGDSARVCTELCAVLDEAGIPHTTIRREDHLFNLASQPPFELGVPASLYEKAELAVRDAFGEGREAIPLIAQESPSAEVLAEQQAEANEWLGARYPEDATVEVWSGEDAELKEMIEMSLRENDLTTRSEEDQGRIKLLVLPEEEARARRIVLEIETGAPSDG